MEDNIGSNPINRFGITDTLLDTNLNLPYPSVRSVMPIII